MDVCIIDIGSILFLGCGGDINETTVIEAPTINYRRNDFRYFHPRINCIWKITAPPKQIVILRLVNKKNDKNRFLLMLFFTECYIWHCHPHVSVKALKYSMV